MSLRTVPRDEVPFSSNARRRGLARINGQRSRCRSHRGVASTHDTWKNAQNARTWLVPKAKREGKRSREFGEDEEDPVIEGPGNAGIGVFRVGRVESALAVCFNGSHLSGRMSAISKKNRTKDRIESMRCRIMNVRSSFIRSVEFPSQRTHVPYSTVINPVIPLPTSPNPDQTHC